MSPNPKLIKINDKVPKKNQSLFSYLYITDSPNKHNPPENKMSPIRAKVYVLIFVLFIKSFLNLQSNILNDKNYSIWSNWSNRK